MATTDTCVIFGVEIRFFVTGPVTCWDENGENPYVANIIGWNADIDGKPYGTYVKCDIREDVLATKQLLLEQALETIRLARKGTQ
jgi:hypothetical protein